MGFSQEMKMQQSLAPQLYQSLEILQMPLLDLQNLVKQELIENPTLEIKEKDADVNLEVEVGTTDTDKFDAELQDLDDNWRENYTTANASNSEDKYQLEIYRSEYIDSGSLISFEINGGKEEAFKILNEFKIIRLAVSLGSVDTLIQHPSSMTHSDMTLEQKKRTGISNSLIRMSVGLEDSKDLLADLKQALE